MQMGNYVQDTRSIKSHTSHPLSINSKSILSPILQELRKSLSPCILLDNKKITVIIKNLDDIWNEWILFNNF